MDCKCQGQRMPTTTGNAPAAAFFVNWTAIMKMRLLGVMAHFDRGLQAAPVQVRHYHSLDDVCTSIYCPVLYQVNTANAKIRG
eukprot:scaffold48261_cov48-Prasinocladus_malaysianus.AAC.1